MNAAGSSTSAIEPDRRLLILASSSPQRRRLLEQAGYRFEVVAPGHQAECAGASHETPADLVARLAYQKAADVAAQLAHDRRAAWAILACDTVAECGGQILGKPEDQGHARRMLELLSGREHHVYSGLCLWPLGSGQPRIAVARTTLRMDPLADARIDEYLASGQWQGKAGAFGYQDRPGWLHITEGSESNVIGLPLELLAQMLGAEASGGWQP